MKIIFRKEFVVQEKIKCHEIFNEEKGNRRVVRFPFSWYLDQNEICETIDSYHWTVTVIVADCVTFPAASMALTYKV